MCLSPDGERQAGEWRRAAGHRLPYLEQNKKTPVKREDARYLRTWHSYEKVIRKPAALATI